MKFIIYDLEFTVLRNRQHLSEIIEWGAVMMRVDEAGGELYMADLFHTHVRPRNHPNLSQMTQQFTGITQEDMKDAPSFQEAVEQFREWAGSDEEYFLCSWGNDDRFQLMRHCKDQQMDLTWIANHNDLQYSFTKKHSEDTRQRYGLKRALELLDFPFTGRQHSGLDDAFNTAKIFRHLYPELKLERNIASEEQLVASETVYSTEEPEGNFPLSGLSALLNLKIDKEPMPSA
ncbi:hypothetical protein SY83_01715 [Paenibacillus swuensis]|uniref:Exonuclease domain-containing protein n=1 Tax=Paenibacillus swuensis TaxID=1178515 RepID=A0A172TEA0_9BACL|nr:3'-5' exonuclease [Paenibacillus swuensis]ANE45256.1 hypothetical protein SY83_01715 [Paenibacillus swuensis]